MYNLSVDSFPSPFFDPFTEPFPVQDIFGILPPKDQEIPLPGMAPWHLPLFRPTTGPGSGPASPGRGIPRGSSRPDFVGVVVGPPEP